MTEPLRFEQAIDRGNALVVQMFAGLLVSVTRLV